ncbi:hypothetical protein ASPCADRAFT_56595 [Aspergillus carbonarius ITEM 5010]|uniref:Uncharacterized protein n=1 Tax=Aspergillus carbonarius (strain ITEM 5010) TaxID=602072 RepID=A0A1R3RBW4_ASPC5|nr:hypothetical protein ASPCADRAFT_56595 [Aspergillus carbonarius ITEM 5010]
MIQGGHPDIFGTLPFAIRAIILIYLEDLASVYSAYLASPAIFHLMHEYDTGRRVIEKIMDLSLSNDIKILIRKFVRLRYDHPMPSLNCFIDEYIKRTTEYACLPRGLPVSAICDILAASSTVRYIAHDGMHEMLDRCNYLQLHRLKRPASGYLRNIYEMSTAEGAEYFPIPKPDWERYQHRDAGPPTIVEEQMAMRAIWQVFIIWELRNAVTTRRWVWPASDIWKLQDMHFDLIWQHALSPGVVEQSQTMADCACMFPWLKIPSETSSSGAETLHSSRNRYRTVKALAHVESWKPSCDCALPSADLIKQSLNFDDNIPGYSYVITNLSPIKTSPCRYVEFRSHRRFGFAIWGQKRLEALGLLYPKTGAPEMPQCPRSEADQLVRWRSVLDERDWQYIEQKRMCIWPGIELTSFESPT